MANEPSKPKARRRLSRDRIQEIIERNLSLYKGEDSFIPYLVELTIYLVEYEYDWSQSQTEAPEDLPEDPKIPERIAHDIVEILDDPTDNLGPIIEPTSETPVDVDCPHCGASIQSTIYICPGCGNLTR